MATAKATLLGMYRYDNTLFNELVLPAGIDKDLFISTLMLKSAEFEILYSDPDFMKKSIGVWGAKWYRTFAEWLRGTQASFNPIHNYDRIEDIRDEHRKSYGSTTDADYTDERTLNFEDERTANLQEQRTANLEDKRTANLEDKRTANLQDKTTFDNKDTNSQTTAGTTQHDVSAYDSSGYVPSSKDTINNGVSQVAHTGTVTNNTTGTDSNATTGTDTMSHTGTDTNNITGTDTMAHTGTDTLTRTGTVADVSGSESNTNIHTAHMYGNIGVTTSAAMLKEFYDISRWSLYDHMSDVFTSELLIPVY